MLSQCWVVKHRGIEGLGDNLLFDLLKADWLINAHSGRMVSVSGLSLHERLAHFPVSLGGLPLNCLGEPGVCFVLNFWLLIDADHDFPAGAFLNFDLQIGGLISRLLLHKALDCRPASFACIYNALKLMYNCAKRRSLRGALSQQVPAFLFNYLAANEVASAARNVCHLVQTASVRFFDI